MAEQPEAPSPEAELEAPLLASLKSAVTNADAYRAVRAAVRLESGIVRLGNRFVPVDRYREIGFVALGNASVSLALGLSDALGERLTQGIVAGPLAPPEAVPFRHWIVPPGPPGSPAGTEAGLAVEELARDLGEKDLLLVALSPGSLGTLARPSPGVDPRAYAGTLAGLVAAGIPGAEIARLLRVGRQGLVGGRLAELAGAGEVETLVLDRGDGGELVGGGPTVPVGAEEILASRATLARLAALPDAALAAAMFPAPPPTDPALRRSGVQRPVVLAGPADALRGASDALIDRRWVCRLASISIPGPPEMAAERLLARTEEIVGELGGVPGGARGGDARQPPRGLAVFAGLPLDGLEGMDEGGVADRFLRAGGAALQRRGSALALLPTSVPTPDAREAPAPGGFVLAGESSRPEIHRPFRMRGGITDVGPVGVVLLRPVA